MSEPTTVDEIKALYEMSLILGVLNRMKKKLLKMIFQLYKELQNNLAKEDGGKPSVIQNCT
jgi:hypothetical protein